jgi:hypothetical protein
LNLSREVRDLIYELAFHVPGYIAIGEALNEYASPGIARWHISPRDTGGLDSVSSSGSPRFESGSDEESNNEDDEILVFDSDGEFVNDDDEIFVFGSDEEFDDDDDEVVVFGSDPGTEPDIRERGHSAAGILPVSFLRTCRQIHSESILVLYSHNNFLMRYVGSLGVEFASAYRTLVKHITVSLRLGPTLCSPSLEEVSELWKSNYMWPGIIKKSTVIAERYPNLQLFTISILQVLWLHRPVFFSSENQIKDQRLAHAAQWLRQNCPIQDERLRQTLKLEYVVSADLGQRGAYDWDPNEFAQAWLMAIAPSSP